jgi:hypothetical protein
MATTESSAPAHLSAEDHDDTVEAHYASLERPHACSDGVVYIGHLVQDPSTSEQVEVVATMLCRRCAGELARSTSVRLIDRDELTDWLEGLREEE